VISVLLIAFLGAVIINSNFIRQEVSVVTIDDIGFSAAEFDYFYITTYLEYRNLIEQQMPELAQFILPSRDISLAQQINPATGESWEDFFMERTIAIMSEVVQRYNLAMAEGFVLPEDIRMDMESELEWLRLNAQFGGFDSLDSLLRQQFGPAINESIYIRIVEMASIASAFEQSIIPDFEFTVSELEDFYFENRDAFDVFTMRLITINADADPEAEDQEAARAEALEAAVARADEMASAIETEDDFIAQARAYDPNLFLEPESTLQSHQGELFPTILAEWLTDPSREYGDVAVISNDINIVYVTYFIERNDNEYLLTSFRQLLFLRQDPASPINPDDFPDVLAYLAEFERLDNEANELARGFHWLFGEYGADEAALDRIVSEYEHMDIDGQLYSNIARMHTQATHEGGITTMRVVPEIEEWLFDPDRQIGDSELIRTEAFGFHLVYFAGFGERFSQVIAENRLIERERQQAHEAWLETLPPVDVSKSGLFSILVSIGGIT
jgi:hypothetical protein